MVEKQTYYVNVQSKEISKVKVGNNAIFTIIASDEDVMLLRKKFDVIDTTEMDNFFRAHVPIVPYHEDKSNDKYDQTLREIFQMIYQLGDEETKSFIKQEKLNESHTI